MNPLKKLLWHWRIKKLSDPQVTTDMRLNCGNRTLRDSCDTAFKKFFLDNRFFKKPECSKEEYDCMKEFWREAFYAGHAEAMKFWESFVLMGVNTPSPLTPEEKK